MADFFIRKGTRLPAIKCTLLRGGLPVDLSLASSVQLIYQPDNGGATLTKTAAFLGDRKLGKVIYDWAAGDTAAAGIFVGYWLITWVDGKQESFPNRGNFRIAMVDSY